MNYSKNKGLKHNTWLLFVITLTVFFSGCDEIDSELIHEKVASAQFDECFYRIGAERNYYNPNDLTAKEINKCTNSRGDLKTNQGYLWGITSSGDSIWFGTASNINSTGLGSVIRKLGLNFIPPFKLPTIVAELQRSTYKNGELGVLGDYRPPRIYTYDTKTEKFTERTPDDPLIEKTYGLRSAGSLNGVVILAGPCFDEELKGINLFAFNAASYDFLGSCNIKNLVDENGQIIAEDINNIRKWLTLNNVLYTTVGTNTGGNVLRWKGTVLDPFKFEVVGTLEDQGVELAYHEKRLFITTWPPAEDFSGVSTTPGEECGLWMTKDEVPEGGLQAGTEFAEVWNVSDYEPDGLIASVYQLGPAISFDGYLYWGTMHVPVTLPMVEFMAANSGDLRPAYLLEAIKKTDRLTALFRGKNFSSGNPKIELLYGEKTLPKYQSEGEWSNVPNNMNATPLYGKSGFGNNHNYYTWSMAVFNNQLYIGTHDRTYPNEGYGVSVFINNFLNAVAGNDSNAKEIYFSTPFKISNSLKASNSLPGADLFKFSDSNSPAVPVTETCFGNDGVYGFRNMIIMNDALYLGTASSNNLHPSGGWELYKLAPKK